MDIDNNQTPSPYARATEGEWSRKRLIRTWLGVLTGLALAGFASFGLFVVLMLWGLSTSDWG